MKINGAKVIKNIALLFLSGGIFYFLMGPKGLWALLMFLFGSFGIVVFCAAGYFGLKRLLQKLLPAAEPKQDESYTLGISTFRRFQFISELTLTIASPIGGIFSYNLLNWLAVKWCELLPGAAVFGITEFYWAAPSLVLGFLFGCFIVWLVLKIFLRDQYKAYIKYFEIDWNFDSQKFFNFLVVVGVVLAGLLMYVGFATYTRFTEEGIYFHRASQFSEAFYPYIQVVKVEEIINRQRSLQDRHSFVVQFVDGREWSSMTFDNNIPDKYWFAMGLVSQKSGKTITIVEK